MHAIKLSSHSLRTIKNFLKIGELSTHKTHNNTIKLKKWTEKEAKNSSFFETHFLQFKGKLIWYEKHKYLCLHSFILQSQNFLVWLARFVTLTPTPPLRWVCTQVCWWWEMRISFVTVNNANSNFYLTFSCLSIILSSYFSFCTKLFCIFMRILFQFFYAVFFLFYVHKP